MKKYISLIFITTLLFSLFTACDREKLDYGLDGDNPSMQGEGMVNFEFALAVETRASEVDKNDYTIRILDSNKNQVGESYKYGSMPSSIQLKVGNYTIEAKSHADFNSTVLSDFPYYVGSEEFEIKKGQTTIIDKLVCTMQNIKVELVVHESLEEILDSYELTATFKAGDASLNFSHSKNSNSDNFTYFPAINESNVLIVQLTGTNGANKVDLSKTYTEVVAGDYRRITFMYSGNIPNGSGDINLDIDTECEIVDKGITVPGIDGGDEGDEGDGGDKGNNGGDEGNGETPNPGTNTIEIVGSNFNGRPFDIQTEVLSIPWNIDDPKEIPLVVKINAPNGIKNLWVKITSIQLVEIFLPLMELDNTFDLVNPGENEDKLQYLGFETGSQLLNKTSADFNITTFTALLAEMDPEEHQFTITVTDQSNQSLERTLKLRVEE